MLDARIEGSPDSYDRNEVGDLLSRGKHVLLIGHRGEIERSILNEMDIHMLNRGFYKTGMTESSRSYLPRRDALDYLNQKIGGANRLPETGLGSQVVLCTNKNSRLRGYHFDAVFFLISKSQQSLRDWAAHQFNMLHLRETC